MAFYATAMWPILALLQRNGQWALRTVSNEQNRFLKAKNKITIQHIIFYNVNISEIPQRYVCFEYTLAPPSIQASIVK